MAKPGSHMQRGLLILFGPTIHFCPKPQEQLCTSSEGERVIGKKMERSPSPLHFRQSEQSQHRGALGGSWFCMSSPSHLVTGHPARFCRINNVPFSSPHTPCRDSALSSQWQEKPQDATVHSHQAASGPYCKHLLPKAGSYGETEALRA